MYSLHRRGANGIFLSIFRVGSAPYVQLEACPTGRQIIPFLLMDSSYTSPLRIVNPRLNLQHHCPHNLKAILVP